MLRPLSRSTIFSLSVVVVGGWGTTIPVHAGIITPDSIASPPAAVSPLVQGTPVPQSQQVGEQYSGLGLLFANAAIGTINGVKVWVPLQNAFEPSTSLNFASPSFILAGLNVPGNADAPAQTNLFRAEFIFGANANAAPMLQGLNRHDLTTPHNGQSVGTGPHGGVVEQLQFPGLTLFSMLGTVSGDTSAEPWGIAQIEVGPVTAVRETPEPGTVILAALGALGVAVTSVRRVVRPELIRLAPHPNGRVVRRLVSVPVRNFWG